MYNDMVSKKGIIQLRICPEQVYLEQKSILNSYFFFYNALLLESLHGTVHKCERSAI